MKTAKKNSAFSLVEVSVALGISAFCLTSIVGLLPVGLRRNQDALEQTVAANCALAIASDLRITKPGNSCLSYNFAIPPANAMDADTQTVYLADDGSTTGNVNQPPNMTGPSPSRYRATVTFTSDPVTKGAVTAHILITWPALADSTKGAVGSYEALIKLCSN
jgi:uncharacterized protein (TIGR02598 family)